MQHFPLNHDTYMLHVGNIFLHFPLFMWPFFHLFVLGKSSIQTDRRMSPGMANRRGEKAGQWQKSLQFFDDMLKAVVAPDDAFCFVAFLSTYPNPPLHNVPPYHPPQKNSRPYEGLQKPPGFPLPRPYYTLISGGVR